MFNHHRDQVEILRAFPDYPWQSLTQWICYHFGKGWWKSYQGEKKYPRNTHWADTTEALSEKSKNM